MLSPDDAKLILDQLVGVEAARSGRDFIYTVNKGDGSTVTGRVADHSSGKLSLVTDDDLGPTAAEVAWDDIESIQITSD